MAQHDYVISNGTGAAVRSDLNNALSAIVTQNSGSTEPTTTYAYQMWADTNAGVMKIRNGANSAWITLYQLDGEWTSIAFENGSAAAPSIYFKDSGTDTGFFSGGTDQVNIATAGTERVEWGTSEVVFNDAGNNYDFRVEGDNNANLLFVDASADAVGIGTSSPSEELHVVGDILATGYNRIPNANEGGFFDVSGNNGITIKGSTNASPHITTFYNSGVASVTIDASRRVGIGTTSPASVLEVAGTASEIARFRGNGASGSYVTWNSGGTNYGYIGPAVQLVSGTSTQFAIRSESELIFASNGGNERARIDTSGRLLVGTSTEVTSVSPSIQTVRAGAGFIAIANSNTVGAAATTLGQIGFYGYQGSYALSATITADADATWSTNDYPSRLSFSTTADGASSPTERMVINSTGEMAVGMPIAPSVRLAVASSSSFIYVGRNSAGNTDVFRVASNGDVSNTNGSYTAMSDAKLKENIVTANSQWNDLKAIRICNWNFKENTGYETHRQIGVIAQELEKVCPGLVFDTPDRDGEGNDLGTVTKGVNQSVLYMKAVKALQEAMERIEILEAKVAAFESA